MYVCVYRWQQYDKQWTAEIDLLPSIAFFNRFCTSTLGHKKLEL